MTSQGDRHPEPPPTATFTERLAHRTAIHAGRERCNLRQQTVEPAFGLIKEVLGFRLFRRRGQAKGSLNWTLVTFAHEEEAFA